MGEREVGHAPEHHARTSRCNMAGPFVSYGPVS